MEIDLYHLGKKTKIPLIYYSNFFFPLSIPSEFLFVIISTVVAIVLEPRFRIKNSQDKKFNEKKEG
jgi:hypothetical protein